MLAGIYAEHAVGRGPPRNVSLKPSLAEFAFVHADKSLARRTRHTEVIVRNRGHRMRSVAIRVVPVAAVMVSVVIVRDVRDIRNARVSDVDVLEISTAVSVVRNERLPPSEREPANTTANSERDANAKVRTADPANQRWRINRTHTIRTGAPSPIVAIADPAAVMERRESPGGVVDPSPSPGRHIDPVTVAIRRPINGDAAW